MNTSRLQLIIEEMIDNAATKDDSQALESIKELIEEITSAYNAPSDWRSIGENLSDRYKDTWIHGELELWEYVE